MSKFRVTCVITIWLSMIAWSFLMLYAGDEKTFKAMPLLKRMANMVPMLTLIALSVAIIWVNRCPDCKRRIIWAHPESEKVCRSCDIVRALTGKSHNGDWNSP